MKTKNPAYVSLTLAACLASLFAPLTASAQQSQATASEGASEPLTFDEMLVLDGKSYARIYGVGLAEAMRRVLVMNDTAEPVETLSSEFAGQIGGLYFTHGSDFGLKMRLTGREKKASRRLVASSTLKEQRQAARQAQKLADRDAAKAALKTARRNTLGISDSEITSAEAVSSQQIETAVQFLADAPADRDTLLRAVSAKTSEVQSRVPSVDSVAYDERRGSVVLTVVGTAGSVDSAAQEALAAMFPVPVAYQYVPKHMGVTAATGGTPNYTLQDSPWCTNAFVGYASSTTTQPGLFSASHCQYSNNSSIAMRYKDTNGTTTMLGIDGNLKEWSTHGDMLFLTLASGLVPSSYFFADKGAAARQLTGRRTMTTTNIKAGTTAGTMVCFYGRTTGLFPDRAAAKWWQKAL